MANFAICISDCVEILSEIEQILCVLDKNKVDGQIKARPYVQCKIVCFVQQRLFLQLYNFFILTFELYEQNYE